MMPSMISVRPMSQLSSRGLRNAPVKNTRNMWISIAPTNISAAQWWICRMTSPPRTSKVMFSVDSYALDISTPCNGTYRP